MDPFSFAVMTVAQFGIGYLFPSEGPRLKDLKISASTYGAVIPEAFGTVRVAGNLIWSDKIREHKKKKRVGLKHIKYYTYTGTFAMACCKGPVTQIRKVWANHKLIYDVTGEGKIAIKKKFKIVEFLGTEDQEPSAAIEKLLGEGNTPAFRGLCYLLFEDIPLEDFGNSLPQISVEVFAAGEASDGAIATPFKKLSPSISILNFQLDGGWGMGFSGSTGQARRFQLGPVSEDFRAIGDLDNPAASHIFGISPTTGDVLAHPGVASNSAPIIRYDSVTLAELARVGVGSSSLTDSPRGNEPGAFSIDKAGNEWMAYVTILDYWVAIQTYDGMSEPMIVGASENGSRDSAFIVGTKGTLVDKPVFYVWSGGEATGDYVSSLKLRKITINGRGDFTTEIVYIYDNPKPTSETGIAFRAEGIHWDPTDDCCVVVWSEGGGTWIGKVDVGAGDFRWKMSINTSVMRVQPCVLETHQLWWVHNSRLWVLDTLTGVFVMSRPDPYAEYGDLDDVPASLLQPPGQGYTGVPVLDENGVPKPVSSTDQMIFDPLRNSLYLGRAEHLIRRGAGPRGKVTLGGLVARLFQRAGLKFSQFDVSQLEVQEIRGYGWASASDLKSILDQLRMVFLFDIVERDGKLVGVMRQSGSNEDRLGRPVRRLTQALLGSTGDGSGMEYWKESRLQEADIPARITLTYMNFTRDMESATAHSTRITDPIPTMFSRQQVALEMGIILTPEEAKNQANKILWSQWSERTRHTSRLPWTYLELDPADIITVTMDDGRQYRERLHQTELGADLGLQIETYSQAPDAYESEAVADGGSEPVTVPVSPPRQARPLIFNTPLLRDQDDSGGGHSIFYSGIGHAAPEDYSGANMWKGVVPAQFNLLYVSDQDVEWATVAGVVPPPRHGAHGLDWETRITVWPIINWFEIESITDDELWAGANLCVIGSEVIQFRDCAQNPDGSWTLWNLLRGRRGTEYACTTHKAGEMFSFLASSTIEIDTESLDAGGKDRYFVAVGDGMRLEYAAMTQLRYAPRDLMPYAPKDIRREVSPEAITLDWKRRTRMGGGLLDGTEAVPLNETEERYEVYILQSPYQGDLSRGDEVPADILYQAETTASTLTIPLPDPLGPWPNESGWTAPYDVDVDTLHVLIYQLSSAVGRGFPGVRSIEPWQDF